MSEPTQNSFSWGRRWLLRLNFLLAILSVLAIIVMVNYLAGGYYKRFNIATNSPTQLSPLTTRILETLTNNVAVTIFFDVDNEAELYMLSSALLNEYQNANPEHITVKTLDYTRYDAQARALLSRHNLSGAKDRNFVLFECNGHSKILYAKTLADYNINEVLSGKSTNFHRSSFRGELLFTSAIFAVTNPRALKSYFLQGHGEHPLDSKAMDGYSKFASILSDELDSQYQGLSLLGTNTIPEDCQLLVIARPGTYRFLPAELEKIDEYLNKGGRMMLLLNSAITNSGIEKVLSKWGVDAGNEPVLERDKHFIIGNSEGVDFAAAKMQPHRILNAILAQKPPGLIRIFYPRPFFINSTNTTPGAPEIKALAFSSDLSICGTNRGSFPLIVAIEQGVIKGSSAPSGGTRIVAIGDSYLFCDQKIDEGLANHDFAYTTLNWLLERPELLLDSLVPRPTSEYQLLVTGSQMTTIEFLFLVGLPGGVLLVGGMVWLRRRR
jgi:hypothetical protein